MTIGADQAEILALQALGWILADEDMTMQFIGSTGADLNAIRAGAADADFLVSVLDFILLNDQMVMGFADSAGIAAETVPLARSSLPGGANVHWT